jgi:membrane protein DedA with SNARE-associated domain
VAAIAGDNAGYWIGRAGGQRLVTRYGRLVRLDAKKLKVGRYLFARHGGKVVILGRFVSVLRAYAAFLAGLNAMRWPRFTVFNAVGGVVWSAVFAFGAFGLGAAATGIGQTVTLVGIGVSGALAVATVVLARHWMRRLEQRAEAAYPDRPPAAKERVPALTGDD